MKSCLSRARLPLWLGALLCSVALSISCGGGDDDNPMDPGNGGDDLPERSTPAQLLSDWLPEALSKQDIALYREILDSSFTFVFLPDDADSFRTILGSENFWDRTKDLQSTTRLFNDTDVTSCSLNVQVGLNIPFSDPACQGCREVSTTVRLVVVVDDPTFPEPVELTVESPQVFVTKPDPDSVGVWVLFRQIDRPTASPIAIAGKADGARGIASIEPTTWGQIKGDFYQ